MPEPDTSDRPVVVQVAAVPASANDPSAEVTVVAVDNDGRVWRISPGSALLARKSWQRLPELPSRVEPVVAS